MGTRDSRATVKALIKSAVAVLLLALALFGSAGTVAWPMAWVYLGLLVIAMVTAYAILIAQAPDLAAERMELKMQDSQPWDLALAGAMAFFGPLTILIYAGLDRRFLWSDPSSPIFPVIGVLLMIAGYAIIAWAMVSNRYFAPLIRIQPERGHAVASGGPYRVIRHPGYFGALLYYLGLPLILQSAWAGIPAGLTIAIVILRTYLEDRVLRRELAGYPDYARNVRCRLVPGIW